MDAVDLVAPVEVGVDVHDAEGTSPVIGAHHGNRGGVVAAEHDGHRAPSQDRLDHRGGPSTIVFILAGDLEDIAAIHNANPAAGKDLTAEIPVVVSEEVRVAHRCFPDCAGRPARGLA